ncbi:hypothetical protein T492DRAFT_928074 [Pavlovales sp. CCMP2436]|nr:hypothetical protein T492DRAFT_928074 [Pavlovales sp. CCMP2436]
MVRWVNVHGGGGGTGESRGDVTPTLAGDLGSAEPGRPCRGPRRPREGDPGWEPQRLDLAALDALIVSSAVSAWQRARVRSTYSFNLARGTSDSRKTMPSCGVSSPSPSMSSCSLRDMSSCMCLRSMRESIRATVTAGPGGRSLSTTASSREGAVEDAVEACSRSDGGPLRCGFSEKPSQRPSKSGPRTLSCCALADAASLAVYAAVASAAAAAAAREPRDWRRPFCLPELGLCVAAAAAALSTMARKASSVSTLHPRNASSSGIGACSAKARPCTERHTSRSTVLRISFSLSSSEAGNVWTTWRGRLRCVSSPTF